MSIVINYITLQCQIYYISKCVIEKWDVYTSLGIKKATAQAVAFFIFRKSYSSSSNSKISLLAKSNSTSSLDPTIKS